jgi:FlaA1/EpsC-like NDP-sugar epimerase
LSYIRLNKHYIHLPYLYLGLVDALIVAGVAWGLQYLGLRTGSDESIAEIQWAPVITLSVVLSCCTLSMGVYTALIREGFSSMVLRTMVSFFLLGSLSLYIFNIVFDGRFINQSMIFWSVLLSTILVCVSRWIFVKIVDVGQLKRRVVIYGAGIRAEKLLTDIEPEVDVLGVKVVGCIPIGWRSPANSRFPKLLFLPMSAAAPPAMHFLSANFSIANSPAFPQVMP